jgi:hypothetical protein
MSTNLVSTIMQSLSPEAIGKVSSSLGLEDSTAQKAIAAAVPGLLAGLANTASSPDGANKLGAVLSQIDEAPEGDTFLRGIPDTGHKNLMETGWSVISSLMGNSSLETLSSVVAQYAGIGQGTVKRLLGFLTPLVLAVLKREQINAGLDSRGVANLLASQRSNIERAMPAGALLRQQGSETRSSRQAAPTTGYGEPVPSASASQFGWAYWLLPALILSGAALYLLPADDERKTAQEINQTTTSASQQGAAKDTAQLSPPVQRELQPSPVSTVTPATAPSAGQGVQSTSATLENDILANISRLRASLQTIKDPASAQAALGDLRDISDRFTKLKVVAQQLSPETRKALAAAVASKVPDLNSLLDRINNEMNSTGEAKPAMDTLKNTLRSDLTSLSKV